MHVKCDYSSLSHPGDMVGARGLALATIILSTTFEVSISTPY